MTLTFVFHLDMFKMNHHVTYLDHRSLCFKVTVRTHYTKAHRPSDRAHYMDH